MGVNHGGFNAAVSEQLLHRANVIAVLKQVSGKRVPQRMRGRTLADAGPYNREVKGAAALGAGL